MAAIDVEVFVDVIDHIIKRMGWIELNRARHTLLYWSMSYKLIHVHNTPNTTFSCDKTTG